VIRCICYYSLNFLTNLILLGKAGQLVLMQYTDEQVTVKYLNIYIKQLRAYNTAIIFYSLLFSTSLIDEQCFCKVAKFSLQKP